MTDEDKTNLDLRKAEELMRGAKTDEDRALALKYQAEGVRNLIQSGLSDPFIQAVESILKREIEVLSGRQSYFLTQLADEFKTNAAWRDRYSKEIDQQGRDTKAILAALEESGKQAKKFDRRLSAVERVVKKRPAERAKEQGRRDAQHQELKDGQAAIVGRLDVNDRRYEEAQQFQEQSTADRTRLNDAVERLDDTVERLTQALGDIQAYLEPGMTPEKAREQQQHYIEMIERHEEELKRLKAERGDAS